MPATWLKWSELPWLAKSDSLAAVVHLTETLLKSAAAPPDEAPPIRERLSHVATEFSVQWAAVVQQTPEWRTLAEFGRSPLRELPQSLLAEALDRDAAGFLAANGSNGAAGGAVAVVPLSTSELPASLLILAGRNVTDDVLPALLCVGRVLGFCLGTAAVVEGQSDRIEQLQSILRIASAIGAERETVPLLERLAQEATRLLDCDRASIFVWDREHKQLIACPALGIEGNTLRLRDDVGLVGQSLHKGTPIRVDDAYRDPRFNQDVDRHSGYRTRDLLCVPLRDAEEETIGVFQVINKNRGTFDADDEETLQLVAAHAANAIRNVREREQLVRSREQLAEQVTSGVRIIGESAAIVAMRQTIQRLAATDLPVLILGESGTGKEVVAQSLHYHGPRKDRPFVAVNCAALTETLLESELFGHEKGSFTDAHEMRRGKFELAEGGTLFLDEIGDMSPGGQAKLLRVLEQKVVTRVGGSQSIPINVRIVAATNAKLGEAVREKRFRQDLYFRLSVVSLDLPPLRERPEDILTLAEHFLKHFCIQAGRRTLPLSVESRRKLQAHDWPGNVRELRNMMERVAFLTAGDQVTPEDLAFILSPGGESPFDPALDLGLNVATKQFQQEYIRRAIRRVNGNMSEAARLLELHRSNLYRKMRQLEMQEVGGLE